MKGPNHLVAEPSWVRWTLIGVTVGFLGLFLVLPLVALWAQAFEEGVGAYVAALSDPDTLSAVRLTLLTAATAVPLNLLFGMASAWAIAKFRFVGKGLLTTLIELPFSVSPVVSGLLFVTLFGAQGWLGSWLEERHIEVLFTVPAIVLATLFVTFPFIARELATAMEAENAEEEEAALSLGANGWQTFWKVTLPNVKWGLLYGVILCNARAMGEFGAVSVVSGHIRGLTNTIPLHVEILYNEYRFVAAFAVASLLTLLALATLALKAFVEWRSAQEPAKPRERKVPARPASGNGKERTQPLLRNVESKAGSGRGENETLHRHAVTVQRSRFGERHARRAVDEIFTPRGVRHGDGKV